MVVPAPQRLRVLRHESKCDRWEMVFGKPDARLRPFVIHYCGYDEQSTSFTRRLEPPGLKAPLIFNLGPAISVSPRGATGWERQAEGFVAGLDDTHALVETQGEQRGLAVYLMPVGAGLVTAMPMRELRGRVVPLDVLFGPSAHLVREELLEAPGWEERFAIVDRFLLARLAGATAPPPSLDRALSRLHAMRGAIEIGALTEELGCSRRYLISVFNDYVGLPPKLYARILRFERALELAGAGEAGWAEIAALCGYYDQAHMIGDFRRFTGRSPTAYASMKLPDGGGLVVRD